MGVFVGVFDGTEVLVGVTEGTVPCVGVFVATRVFGGVAVPVADKVSVGVGGIGFDLLITGK